MKLKTAFAGLILLLASAGIYAQENTREHYLETYERMVSKVGAAGLGIETLLDRWQADYPDDTEPVLNRFLYYYTKSQTKQVIVNDQKRHLGNEPILSLADSLGKVKYYHNDIIFDDTVFGESINWIDKAIRIQPDRIDLRFFKVAALTGYEKEHPELAVAEIKNIIDYNVTTSPKWQHPSYEVTQDFFDSAIQEYCYLFFRYATPAGYEAFRQISERMLSYYPANTIFLDNLGSYYFVAKQDNKMALKYYNNVLKINPSDITAIRSCVLMFRRAGNVKQEKKYLEMMVKYGEDETERASAQVRLNALNAKK